MSTSIVRGMSIILTLAMVSP